MTAPTLEVIQQDHLAMSVARALTVANETALLNGIEPRGSLVTISEESSSAGPLWRIHYGARDYVGRRGGDLSVIVEGGSGVVRRVIRGQ